MIIVRSDHGSREIGLTSLPDDPIRVKVTGVFFFFTVAFAAPANEKDDYSSGNGDDPCGGSTGNRSSVVAFRSRYDRRHDDDCLSKGGGEYEAIVF